MAGERADWKRFGSADEVRTHVEGRVPPGASLDQVRAFTAAEGLECSGVVEGTMHCSAAAGRRSLFVSAKWLLRFHFGEGETLRRVEVEEGLTGP